MSYSDNFPESESDPEPEPEPEFEPEPEPEFEPEPEPEFEPEPEHKYNILTEMDNCSEDEALDENFCDNVTKVMDENSFCIDTSGLIPSKKSCKQEPSFCDETACLTSVIDNSFHLQEKPPISSESDDKNCLQPCATGGANPSCLQPRPRGESQSDGDSFCLQPRPRGESQSDDDSFCLQPRPNLFSDSKDCVHLPEPPRGCNCKIEYECDCDQECYSSSYCECCGSDSEYSDDESSCCCE